MTLSIRDVVVHVQKFFSPALQGVLVRRMQGAVCGSKKRHI